MRKVNDLSVFMRRRYLHASLFVFNQYTVINNVNDSLKVTHAESFALSELDCFITDNSLTLA